MGVADEATLEAADLRVLQVDAFFESFGCRQPNYAAEYVKAADRYGVDYRMLPAISILESTCGNYQRLNNYWGWNSARTGFRSVTEGIQFVTRQLAQADPYRNQEAIEAKLHAYNPYPHYVRAAKRLMELIGDHEPPAAP